LPALNWLSFPASEPAGGLGRSPVPTVSLDEFLDGAAAAGWRRVGLDDITISGLPVGDLGEQLRRRDLSCSDVGVLPVGTPEVLRAATRLATIGEAAGASICIAAFFAEIDRPRAVRELRECSEILGAAGMRVALEFASYGGLTRFAVAVELCDAVGWEGCGVLVDTWHFFRTDAPWAVLEALDAEQIALVHVNDGPEERGDDPVREGRFGRLPAGAGGFPLAEFAAALGGYSGPVSSEVLSDAIRLRPVAEGARVLLAGIERSWPR
jgi:sugar phosphate isomerase/epimerase